jgi:hypothetical protein
VSVVSLPSKDIARPFPTRRGNFYWIEGMPYVSVTTVLQEVAKQDFLLNWSAEAAYNAVCADPTIDLHTAKNAWRKTRDKAGDKGSLLHSLYEAKLRSPDQTLLVEPPTEVRGHWDAFLRWLDQAQPSLLLAESTVVNDTYGYAGTGDLWAQLGETIYLVDYKTSGFADLFSWSMQLAAYSKGEYVLTLEGDKRPAIDVEGVGVLQTRADGTFSFYDLSDRQEQAWKDFTGYLHEWRQRHGKQDCTEACWCKQ